MWRQYCATARIFLACLGYTSRNFGFTVLKGLSKLSNSQLPSSGLKRRNPAEEDDMDTLDEFGRLKNRAGSAALALRL